DVADQPRLLTALELQIGQEVSSFLDFEPDIHARGALRQEIATPGGKYVRPSLDRVYIAAGLVRREPLSPAVVVAQGHRNAEPFLRSLPAAPAAQPRARHAHREKCRPTPLLPRRWCA